MKITSQNKIAGWVSSSVAKLNLFFSPPDKTFCSPSPPMRVCLQPVSPVRSSMSFIMKTISFRLTRRSNFKWAITVRCSKTVSDPKNRSSWCTNPLRCRIKGPTWQPFTSISPCTTVSSVKTILLSYKNFVNYYQIIIHTRISKSQCRHQCAFSSTARTHQRY